MTQTVRACNESILVKKVSNLLKKYDCIIVGAGAAGLMCALTASARGRKTLLLERNEKPGAKILISGGGRCNFTNETAHAGAYLSQNPHFAKSALSRYGPAEFLELLASHQVTWHEKTLGQLFCDQRAARILEVLLEECTRGGVRLEAGVDIETVSSEQDGYRLTSSKGEFLAPKLVLASGGISIPKMGATDFAYRVARQYGAKIIEPIPALVPLEFDAETVAQMKAISGVSAESLVTCGKISFRENLLFTHRGLSGPAILQISSYWRPGEAITVNLLPNIGDAFSWLRNERDTRPKVALKTILSEQLAARLADWVAAAWPGNLADMSNKHLQEIAERLSAWRLTPTGTEGFKKAEVTKGGVDTRYLSSKTMEMKSQQGLYFIGECVDVTGWLGGYNFQWAWASGHACGTHI